MATAATAPRSPASSKASSGADSFPASSSRSPAPSPPPDSPLPPSSAHAFAASTPAPSGYIPGQSIERVDQRTATSQTFDNPDGTHTARLYSAPEFWQDPVNGWTPINRTIAQASSGGFASAPGPFSVAFAHSPGIKPLVTTSQASLSIGFGLQGASSASTAVASPVSLTYADVMPGVDLRYSVLASGVKELIVLKSQLASGSPTLVFPLTLQGMTAASRPDGSIGFYDSSQKLVAVIPRGFAGDVAPGTPEVPVTYQLLTQAGGTVVSVGVDPTWLADPARKYPVTIDPTVEWQTDPSRAYGTYVSGDSPSGTFPHQQDNVGYVDHIGVDASNPNNVHDHHTFLYWDLGPVSGQQIVSGIWHGYFYDTSAYPNTFAMHPITSSWGDYTVSWASQPAIDGSQTVLGQTDFNGESVTRDLTGWVVNWANGTWANHGIEMDAQGQRYYYRMASDDQSGQNPYLDVTYTAPSSVPSGPRNVQASPGGAGALNLSWLPPLNSGSSPVSLYAYYAWNSDGTYTGISGTACGSCTSTTVTGFSPGSSYYFSFYAINSAGWSPYALSNLVTASATVPTAPQNAAASLLPADGSVTVSWAAPASNGGAAIDSYSVNAYRTSDGAGAGSIGAASGATAATFSSLTPGTSYYFTACAHNSVGWSPCSQTTSLTVQLAAPYPCFPASGTIFDTFSPSLSACSAGQVSLQFTITANGTPMATSPWVTGTPLYQPPDRNKIASWTVPMGVLTDGADYGWSAVTRNPGGFTSGSSQAWDFKVDAQRLGDRSYFPMQSVPLGAGLSTSVNAYNGNLVVSKTDVSLPTVAAPFVISRTYNSRGAGKPVYVDDAIPYGATPSATWTWDTSTKWNGTQSLKIPAAAGLHESSFSGAQAQLFVPYGSMLVTYVYVDPAAIPSEVLLGFTTTDGSSEHRAYWGQNLIARGTDGTPSRQLTGPIPAAGQWVRFEVAASAIGLEGKSVNGISYTLYDGQGWFDKTYLGDGPLGYGWTLSAEGAMSELPFHTLIQNTGSSDVELLGSDGAAHFFYPSGANTYASLAGDFATLVKSVGGWRLTTADGTLYSFDAVGHPVSVSLPSRNDRPGWTYIWNAAGQLQNIQDAMAVTTTAQPIPIQPNGQLTLHYDTSGRMTSISADFDGGATLVRYAYDANNQLVAVTDASGNVTKYTYDATTHDLLTIQTPRGTGGSLAGAFTTTFGYQRSLPNEEYERVAQIHRPHTDGSTTTDSVTSFDYDPANRTTKVTDPKGNLSGAPAGSFTTTYVYNAQGNPITVTDASGNSAHTVWSAENLPTSVTDRTGATTTFAYDGAGNLCRETLPVSNTSWQPATTQYFYDEFAGTYICSPSTLPKYSLKTRTVDAEGRVTTASYLDPVNGKPWLVAETAGAGTPQAATTSYSYYQDPAQPWTYGARQTKTMSNGNATSCNPSCKASFTTTYTYWGTSDTYSFPGNPALANVPQLGWLKASSQPGNTPITCAGVAATSCHNYDAAGNQIHTLDAKGDAYAVYDASNRILATESLGAVSSPDPSKYITTAYDGDGNVVKVTDPAVTSDATASSYDDLNRLASSTDAWGATTTYSYDPDSNALTKTTPALGKTTYTYDGLDRLSTLTDPRASATLGSLGYNCLTCLSGGVTTYLYDAEGRVVEKDLGNVIHVEYRYNAAGWQDQVLNRTNPSKTDGEGSMADYSYDYDGTGKKISAAHDGPTGDPSIGVVYYHYDALGRLTDVTEGFSQTTTRHYDFDFNSNRVDLKTNGALTTSYSYNALDQLTGTTGTAGSGTFGYNAAGETTTHGLPSGTTQAFGYDPRGLPASDSDGTTTTTSLLDGLGRVVRATTSKGGAPVSDLLYHYDGPSDSPSFMTDAISGQVTVSYFAGPDGLISSTDFSGTYYKSYNGHGDLVQETNTLDLTKYVYPLSYDEFGNPEGSVPTLATPYGYTGAHQRETSAITGVVRMGARQYDPSLGRFLMTDPVPGGSCTNYDYVCGDPINGLDLNGQTWKCHCTCNVEGAFPWCTGRVEGLGTGKTQSDASKAGKKDCDQWVPPGCHKRHCQCSCTKSHIRQDIDPSFNSLYVRAQNVGETLGRIQRLFGPPLPVPFPEPVPIEVPVA